MYLSAAAITKTLCLSIASAGICLSIVPPQPKPPAESREKFSNPSPSADHPSVVHPRTTFSFDYKAAGAKFGVTYFPYIFSTWAVFMAILDAFHTLDLLPNVPKKTRALNLQLISGIFITISASILRFAAFQDLGKHFTYHLSILPDHKLITDGLYSYVRHPSYTAILSIFAGVLLTVTAPGSVLYDCLGAEWTRQLTIVLGLAIVYGGYLFVSRAGIEDQVLRREFGKDWEEWARVVKYKFIPGVI